MGIVSIYLENESIQASKLKEIQILIEVGKNWSMGKKNEKSRLFLFYFELSSHIKSPDDLYY